MPSTFPKNPLFFKLFEKEEYTASSKGKAAYCLCIFWSKIPKGTMSQLRIWSSAVLLASLSHNSWCLTEADGSDCKTDKNMLFAAHWSISRHPSETMLAPVAEFILPSKTSHTCLHTVSSTVNWKLVCKNYTEFPKPSLQKLVMVAKWQHCCPM